MSNPSPRTSEAEVHASDADAQSQMNPLEEQLAGIDLNDSQSSLASHAPGRNKLSAARDLLEKLNKRRLGVTQLNFTAGSTQAGKGAYGEVVVATLALDDDTSSKSANQVAVKKFLFGDNVDDEKFLRAFANELHILDWLDHPNIIKLFGFVEDMRKRLAWLVFPWEANGNVREFLLSGKWELPERVSLIQDVVLGLEHLHTRQQPIRHGDLKSLNILVNSDRGSPRRQAASTNSNETLGDGCPEVTISTANTELTLTSPGWSFRWAAPEILNEEDPCLASDIWALGWIAWEIITDNYPFPEVKTNNLIVIKVVMGLLPSLHVSIKGKVPNSAPKAPIFKTQIHTKMRVFAALLAATSIVSQVLATVYVTKPIATDQCSATLESAINWRDDESEPKERPSTAECPRVIQWAPSTIPRARSGGTSQIRSAALLVEMADMNRLQGRYREALKLSEDGLSVARSAGDKKMIVQALYLVANSHQRLYTYDKAEECWKELLAVCTSVGARLGQATAWVGLGEIDQVRSNHAKAEESFTQALALFKSIAHSLGQAEALRGLGRIHLARSNYTKAEESFAQALAIFTSVADSLGQGNALYGLGQTHLARSNHAKAEESFTQALTLYKSIADSLGQANALDGLGEIHQARSNYARAEESFSQALAISTSIADSRGQANALYGLGQTHQAQSNHAKAEESFTQALTLYKGIAD
ncbi:hypothetical protein M407DRAFT_25439, partial [Tulasnella calospora MUT 4182]